MDKPKWEDTISSGSDEMLNRLTGTSTFKDTGRKSSGPAEAMDSIIGAPARTLIDQALKGNISFDGLTKVFHQIGADPETAPTGKDIVAQYTQYPDLQDLLGRAIDMGAQLPGAEYITPGVIGEIRGVKDMGKVADAVEAFAARGKAPPSTETKIAQMHGETGEVRDAMPELIDRAKTEMEGAKAPKGVEDKPFWHDENDHSFTDDSKDYLDKLDQRGTDEELIKKAQGGGDHKPHVIVDGAPFSLPNYSAKPMGVIGEPRIQGTSSIDVDPFQWSDTSSGAGKQLLARHNSLGLPAEIHTSSDLIARDDYLKNIPEGSTVNIHMLSGDPTMDRIMFPGNASFKRQELAAKKLEDAGINVNKVYPSSGEDYMSQSEKAYGPGRGGDDTADIAQAVQKKLDANQQLRDSREQGIIPIKPDSYAHGGTVRPQRLAAGGVAGPSFEDTAPADTPSWDQTQDPEEKFGGLGGMAAAAPLAGLRAVTFGGSDWALTHLGVKPETLEGLKTQNPFTGNLSEVASILLAPESGLVGLAGKLGRGAEMGTKALNASSAAAKAVGYGAEGALYGLGQSVSENALGEHKLVSEKTLANVGLSAAFMAGIGSLVGKYAGKGFSAAEGDPSSAESKFEAFKMANSAQPGSAESVISQTGLPAEDQVNFIKRFAQNKPNAESLRAEFKENGLPEVLGMMSNNETVQKLASAISQLPTAAGDAVRVDVDQGFNQISSLLKDSLGGGEGLDVAGNGAKAKEQILDLFEAKNSPLRERYAEREALGQVIKLPDDEVLKFYDSLKAEEGKFKNVTNEGRQIIANSAESFIKEAAHEAGSAGTSAVSNLDAFGKSLAQKARTASRLGEHDAAEAYNLVRNRVSDFVDQQMIKSEKEAVSSLGDAGELSARDIIAEHKSLKDDYRDFQKTMGEFLQDTRLGKKARTERGLSEVLSKIPDEKFIKKIFDPQNAKGLMRLKSKWPEVYETLASHYKGQLWADAAGNKEFNHLKLLNDITNEKKLSAGVRDILFSPSELDKMEVAKRWIKNLPPKIGPSGTPEGLEYMQMAKSPIKSIISHGLNEVGSTASKKLIEHLTRPEEAVRLKTLLNIDRAQNKTDRSIRDGIKSILNGSGRAVTAKVVSKITSQNFQEKSKEIREAMNNPSLLQDKISNMTDALADHAPNVSSAMQVTTIQGLRFLASKLPQSPVGFFNETFAPSQSEISSFNRYYTIVEDPIHALTQVEEGTLNPETLETLSQVYPSLYQEMRQKVFHAVTEKKNPNEIPYKAKMGISFFLGQPLDKSLMPASILANQQSLAPRPTDGQMAMANVKKSDSGKVTLAERTGINHGQMES